MRLTGRVRRGTIKLALVLTALVTVACGGGDDGGNGGGGGGGGAEDAVRQFVTNWQRASGPSRDDITAGQMRLLLTGDLKAQTEGVVAGGSNPQRGSDFGQTRSLNKIYNEFMTLPIPPDQGMEVVESASAGEGQATVTVKLLYSPDAAGVSAAAGLIAFEDVNAVHQTVIAGPVRVFTLSEVDGKWLISAIAE